MEIWKDIPELGGKYQCSSYGRIRRVNKDPRSEKYKILKAQETKDGYISVNPTKDYRKRVHRIVAELFIENPHQKKYVNHKDLNKKNNHVDNLEWVTESENSMHAQLNNMLGRMHVFVQDKETGNVYRSIKDASRVLGYPYTYASKIIREKGEYKNLVAIEKTYQTIL